MSATLNNALKQGLLILSCIIAFYASTILSNLFNNWATVLPDAYVLRGIALLGIRLFFPALVIGIYFRKNCAELLGLKSNVLFGMIVAAFITLPMTVGIATVYPFSTTWTMEDLWWNVIHAAFYEELLFRAILFGILFRKLNWGFIPAALVGAFLFGIGHIYQGHDFGSAMGAFAITAVGAAWFSWLYIEWQNNLWVPIFLHFFMNLSWLIYNVEGGAIGSGAANYFRLGTIVLSVTLTIYHCKKQGYFVINKCTLLT